MFVCSIIPKKLINDPADAVKEYIQGLVATYPKLQHLDGFPRVKVVLRADVSPGTYDKVAVISGGGSGYEPAHAGFVGEGMLTAAICGEIFRCPPVESILAGIRAVTGPRGCLLVVKNYPLDRLLFGLAAEQAKTEGYRVEMVVVGDECSRPPQRGFLGRRGLTGIVLVHKIAGAAAADGLSLSDVAYEAKRAAAFVGTSSVGLTACTEPGRVRCERLEPLKIELGPGLDGEHCRGLLDYQPADNIVAHIIKEILSEESMYVPIVPGCRVAMMVSGLGATTDMEAMIAAGKAVSILQLHHGIAVDRVYTGSFMTLLDTSGISISLMELDRPLLSRLDAPTDAPSWPVGAACFRPPLKRPVPTPRSIPDEVFERPSQVSPLGLVLEAAIKAAAMALIESKDELNEQDKIVGDGDCGSAMLCLGVKIREDMGRYPLNDPIKTVKALEYTMRNAMKCSKYGLTYQMIMKSAYNYLNRVVRGGRVPTPRQWAGALEFAVVTLGRYLGAKAGDRTLLDALIPASDVLNENLYAGMDPIEAFVVSAEAAVANAEATKNIPIMAIDPSTGRLAKIPDANATAAALWYHTAALAVKEEYSSSSSSE